MIFEENIMDRIIKVKVADDVLADIKTKYFVKYTISILTQEKLWRRKNS